MKIKRFNESFDFGHVKIDDDRVVYEGSDFFIAYDAFPVSEGHLLIITKGNEVDFFELSDSKKKKLTELIVKCKQIIEESHSPDGYNIGMNVGEAAGQSVMQFHCHVIPRYKGDVENPKGGVRHSVMGKGHY